MTSSWIHYNHKTKHNTICIFHGMYFSRDRFAVFGDEYLSIYAPTMLQNDSNILRPEQNGWHFADVFRCISWKKIVHILIQVSVKIIAAASPIENKSGLFHGVSCGRTGDKSLSKLIMHQFSDAYTDTTKPQCVNVMQNIFISTNPKPKGLNHPNVKRNYCLISEAA